MLHQQIILSTTGQKTPIVFLHGLFGYGRNWQRIARAFSEHPVILPDLRNHGKSFHHEDFSLSAMAQDIEDMRIKLKGKTFILIGHSLGGKVAMQYALDYGQHLEKLIVLDIAPKAYPMTEHTEFVQHLSALPLKEIAQRSDADRYLRTHIPTLAIRQFLLSNLRQQTSVDGTKTWQWQMNLNAMKQGFDTVQTLDFDGKAFTDCPVHFIGGANSNYITSEDLPVIRAYFPDASCEWIPDAGHWLHAEQPEALIEVLQQKLSAC